MKNNTQVPTDSMDVSCNNIDFKELPIDMLCDYILNVYHRNIRTYGPQIQVLIDKACQEQGQEHPSLFEVQELFEISMLDLEHHLQKEEQVLFPYIYMLDEAKKHGTVAPRFHCGSIANPIEVMKIEHDAERQRYSHIDDLTGGYSCPEDASETYRNAMFQLRAFNQALIEHINVENDILFPAAIKLYDELSRQEAESLA